MGYWDIDHNIPSQTSSPGWNAWPPGSISLRPQSIEHPSLTEHLLLAIQKKVGGREWKAEK
jgi:hypothetical protein